MYTRCPLINGEIYHLFNRGVEKRTIFLNLEDYRHFLETIFYYQYLNHQSRCLSEKKSEDDFTQGKKIIDIFCYCLMPNHFHLLLKQREEGGTSIFMSQIQNSYTRYFNIKYKRVGNLFQGPFKSVRVKTEEQLLHLSRYIHLNPYTAQLTKNLKKYPWSSYPCYLDLANDKLCHKDLLLASFRTSQEYERFTMDYADYACSLERIKHLLYDN